VFLQDVAADRKAKAGVLTAELRCEERSKHPFARVNGYTAPVVCNGDSNPPVVFPSGGDPYSSPREHRVYGIGCEVAMLFSADSSLQIVAYNARSCMATKFQFIAI
jgi:hypothetical protein